ncbi:MAG: hypothetical protein NDJ92_09180, partial [Thermoanaerobaculia bacterium]|nr:hypothetical protein [Thermoanaerobaculia bacterium]
AARGNGAISGEPNSDRGSAGTVYVREGQTESLVIDNGGVLSTLVASLPTPGTVEVGSTAWPEVSLTTSTPAWIEGARVECSVGGSLVGDWRIADRPDATRLLLEGDAPASPLTGASCRGYWKFDRVIVRNGGRYRVPLLRTSLLEGTADGLIDTTDLEGDAIVAAGNARVSGRVDADSLTITSGRTFEAAGTIEVGSLYVAQGARLVQRQTPVTATALTYPGLDLRVGNTITVDGTISATGSGFRGSAGHLGRTWWGIAASYLGAGGSFGGRGGDAGSSALAGAVYGSVSNPREPGAAGAEAGWPYGGAECDLPECAAGGGVISIKAANLVLNGSIESRGQSVLPSPSPYASQSGSGSGGSISIDVTALSGSGSIRADGGPRNAPGGGGRVAVRSGSSPTGNILAAGGAGGAAAGTIVTFRKGSSVFGDLVVDNANLDAPAATELPSLGSGVAESGSGGGVIVTDRSSIPPWNVGRFVEVRTSSGSLKGIWQIVGVDGATIALESGANVSPGDRWQAVYRFDSVTVRRAGRLASVDPVLAPGYGPPDGTLSLAGGQPVEVLGGSTIKVVVNGTDAQSLQRVILRANGPVTGASVTQARNVTGTSTTQPFDVGVLATAQEGAVVRIVAEIVDEIGTVVVTEELAFTVLRDEIPPTISSVTIEPFVTDSRYASGTPLNISVVASDNVGVASVSAEIMGSSMADGVPPYQYAWLVPKTVADTPVDIVITVLDTKGHATRETRSITIVPAAGGTAPVVAWTWPSAAATVPAGHPLRLGVTAVDDSGVVRLEIFEEDATLPIHTFDSSSFSTTSLATEATALLPAQPGSRTFRVRAHDISPVYSESTIRVESVAAVLIDAVNPDWVALQSAPGVLASGTLTVNDPKRLAGLYVLSGATVTHASYESSHDNKAVDLVVAGDVWIERGGGIDVTGRGFRAGTSYPGATTPGLGSGGSHVGHGGLWNTPASTSFGSVYRPMEAGAGGGESGSDGGGVIRLQADRVVVDGAIQADGTLSFRSGGAGGSIWITAREFGGRGELSARNLGVANYGGGGGGAIAIDYDALTGSTPPAVSAAGGASLRRLPGSAGSIVQRVGTSRYGVLKADNGGVTATTTLPSLGSGFAASGSGGAHLETGSAVAVPPYFAGHWIEIRTAGGELKGRWRVKQVVGFGVDLEPNGSEAIDVQVGDAWQGVYVFSAVETSGGASLSSTDPIRIDTSVRD